MKADPREQEVIRQYLLGQMPQGELGYIDEKLLTDSDFYEELLITEDELIDQYLAGQLAEPERKSFETHFLVPLERQQKVRFARSLRKYVDETTLTRPNEELLAADSTESVPDVKPQPKKRTLFSFLPTQRPIVAYVTAAAILLVVLGVSWLAIRKPDLSGPGNVFTATLTPGVTRDSGNITRIPIPADTDTLRLRLVLMSNDYQSYRAELLNESGSILIKEDLNPESEVGAVFISLFVPTSMLGREDYQVKLSGRLAGGGYENISGYRFRVIG